MSISLEGLEVKEREKEFSHRRLAERPFPKTETLILYFCLLFFLFFAPKTRDVDACFLNALYLAQSVPLGRGRDG